MAKLVFFNLPAYGHINPTLQLTRELVQRGDEVWYYTGEAFEASIAPTGAHFRPYPLPFDIDLVEISQNIFRSARMLMDYAHDVLPALLEEVRALQPDYVIHDSLCIWGKVVARQLGVPAVCSSAIMQPVAASRPYRRILAGRMARMLWQGKSALLPFFWKSLLLRRRYGMPFYYIPHAYINREALNLCYTSRYVHPAAELLGPDYLLIGPPGSPPVSNSPFPLHLLQGKKVVYISLGTVVSAGQLPFYRSCIEAFREMDLLVVLSTGQFDELQALEPIPPNFIVRTYAPQPLLMPYTHVFISHGGMNSIHDALRHEVPLLVIPQTFEQTINAIRVQELGAGISWWKKKDRITPQNLQAAVKRLLTEPAFATNLRKIKASFEAAGGIKRAIEAIEHLKQASPAKQTS